MANEKRLIDANEYPCNTCYVSYCYKNCDKFNAWLEKTVNAVEVVHGRWVDRYGNKYANRCYDCSECKGTALYKPEADELGHWRFVQALTDYCPNFGAKMDLED